MQLKLLNSKGFLILFSTLTLWSLASSADLTKQEAFEILKQQGLKWKMINTLVEDAKIKSDEAESAFKPKVQLAVKQFYAKINPIQYGGDDKSTLDQVGFGTTALELNWPLLDPVAKAEIKFTRTKSDSSKLQAQQNETDLTALMLLQYLNVQKLVRQQTVMNANLEKSQLIYKLAQTKRKVGAGIPLDVARARNLYELDRLKKINTLNRYLKAQHDLATTLGVEKLKELVEPLKIEKMKSDSFRLLLNEALATRPDLKSAELNVQASNELVNDSNKIIFPKLALWGEIGTTQASLFGFPAKTATGLLGIMLTIPLETGGIINAKKREALSLQNKASLQLQQTRLEVLSQVKEALEQILSTDEALAAAQNYVNTVTEESNIAEKRFTHGVSNILDYTSSHTNLSNAEDTLTDAMFNFETAKLNYYRTLGSFEGYFANKN